MNFSANPLRFTKVLRDDYTNKSRLVDRVRDAFMKIITDSKLPRIEPDIDAAQIEIFR